MPPHEQPQAQRYDPEIQDRVEPIWHAERCRLRYQVVIHPAKCAEPGREDEEGGAVYHFSVKHPPSEGCANQSSRHLIKLCRVYWQGAAGEERDSTEDLMHVSVAAKRINYAPGQICLLPEAASREKATRSHQRYSNAQRRRHRIRQACDINGE